MAKNKNQLMLMSTAPRNLQCKLYSVFQSLNGSFFILAMENTPKK